MIRKLWNQLRGRKSRPNTPALAFVYQDAARRRWFEYANPLEMPIKRLIALEAAAQQAELCLTRERMTQLADAMEQAANKGKIVELYALIAELKTRLTLTVEEETLLQTAACYFVLEDEDAKGYPAAFQNQKIELWRQDPEAAAFFLRRLLTVTEGYNERSTEAILNYLEETKKSLAALNQLSSLPN